jgi:predicted enzyme related to lactoylglutathione lyase
MSFEILASPLLALLSLSALSALPAPGAGQEERGPRIIVTSVLVDDQDKALRFYTDVLGFVKKQDLPVGKFRWLTVVSPESPDGVELLLEPNDNPAALTFQKAIFDQGIPLAMFGVDDLEREYGRLRKLGVAFRTPPTPMGQVGIAVLEDTCGNLIQLTQK